MKNLSESDISRVIEMASDDSTSVTIIEKEQDVIEIMRREMKTSSFKMWRKRVSGKNTKHLLKRSFSVGRHRAKVQGKPR